MKIEVKIKMKKNYLKVGGILNQNKIVILNQEKDKIQRKELSKEDKVKKRKAIQEIDPDNEKDKEKNNEKKENKDNVIQELLRDQGQNKDSIIDNLGKLKIDLKDPKTVLKDMRFIQKPIITRI